MNRLIEIVENCLLTETPERDRELAEQIVVQVIHALSAQTDEKMVEEIAGIILKDRHLMDLFYEDHAEVLNIPNPKDRAREIHSKVQAVYEARIQEAVRKECEAILKLYEDTGCVVEDESPQYSFWQTLNNRINSLSGRPPWEE